jgi:hypothetical protein
VELDSQNPRFCAYRGNGERNPHQDCQPGKITKVSFERLEESGNVMHLSQNVVETFIDRIEVFNDERVKIHFTFEDVLAGYAE